MNAQIKSRKRVSDHGEVFTSEKEVKAMLDLVKQETLRVDSRFLEPACGEGNFLIEVLKRKLDVAKRQATPPRKKNPIPSEFERQSVIAISSLYGVDLLSDNVECCKKRLYDYWLSEYENICGKVTNELCKKTIKYILDKNILCGNALTLKKVDSFCNDLEMPIIFSEWSFLSEQILQRKDYRFDKLVEGEYEAVNIEKRKKISNKTKKGQLDLFNDLIDPPTQTPSDEGEYIKSVIADYRKIHEYG